MMIITFRKVTATTKTRTIKSINEATLYPPIYSVVIAVVVALTAAAAVDDPKCSVPPLCTQQLHQSTQQYNIPLVGQHNSKDEEYLNQNRLI